MKVEGLDRFLYFMRTFPGRLISREKRIREKAKADLRDDIRSEIKKQDIYETGGYYRSVRVVGDGVQTDRPDGLRHEFGFIGEDSLGRAYDISPRPHWRPAIDRMRQNYPKAIVKEIKTLVNKR